MGKVATDWGEGWNKVLDPTGKRIIKAQCDYCKKCLSNIGLNARIKHRNICMECPENLAKKLAKLNEKDSILNPGNIIVKSKYSQGDSSASSNNIGSPMQILMPNVEPEVQLSYGGIKLKVDQDGLNNIGESPCQSQQSHSQSISLDSDDESPMSKKFRPSVGGVYRLVLPGGSNGSYLNFDRSLSTPNGVRLSGQRDQNSTREADNVPVQRIRDSKIEEVQNSCRIKLLDTFEPLLTNKEFSDITVIADGKSFYLHKCILSVHSSAFKDMFENDVEKNLGAVEIQDVNYEVLKEIFRFIYTGRVNDIKDIICDLFIAADNYNIVGLKDLCEETMFSYLSQENAVKYLNFAIINNAERLKEDTINWISIHLKDFIKTPEFHEFGMQHPDIVMEITEKYVEK